MLHCSDGIRPEKGVGTHYGIAPGQLYGIQLFCFLDSRLPGETGRVLTRSTLGSDVGKSQRQQAYCQKQVFIFPRLQFFPKFAKYKSKIIF